MSQANANALSATYLIDVLFRHKKKAILVFLAVLCSAVFLALFSPRTYQSEAKLFVRESIALDPTATVGSTVAMQRSQDSEINSVVEILGSRQIRKGVVAKVGAEKIVERDREINIVLRTINNTMSKPRSLLRSLLDSAAEQSPTDDNQNLIDPNPTGEPSPTVTEELAILRLADTTTAAATANSNVVTITAKAGSRRLAQTIAQSTVDAFIQEHVRLNRTDASFDFFVEQTVRSDDKLRQKLRQLEQLKSKHGILSVEGEREALQAKLQDIELAAMQADRELAYTGTKIGELERATANLGPQIVTESMDGLFDAAHASMRSQLYELEIREGELLQTYVDTHPMVTAVRNQREALAKILDSQPKERTHTTRAINPTWQALKLDLEQRRADSLALRARRELLDEQLIVAHQELEALNGYESRIRNLQRDVEVAEANYRIHADRLEQARIDAALGTKSISNVKVLQPASYVRKAVSPKTMIIFPAGILVGFLAALSVAVLAESMDDSLRTAEQTETCLGVPVVLTIPDSSRFEQQFAEGARYGST
jgi:uncharacterized protein involved in exopolysaccharide biosynthesis